MNIQIINKKISETELKKIAEEFYGSMIKGVVDIELGVLAMGGEYHMDANMILIENGSKQQNVWGFNWYFEKMRNSIFRAKSIIKKIEEFPEMQGRTGELEILESIIDDLNLKKLEVDKDQLMNYFTPFAMRLVS